MPKYQEYYLTVDKKKLSFATDMLRYDDAYEVEERQDRFVIHCARYTPDRWESFGVTPNVIAFTITAKKYEENMAKATGFTQALRFAQRWAKNEELTRYGIHFVEG